MKCPECKTENEAEAVFCSNCGIKLIEEDIMEDINLENNQNAKKGMPCLFISYHSIDVKIANAFYELILSAGGERVMPFYCEQDDRKYGEEWYKEITEKINKSKNMVCLLTRESCEKPWILYEAGIAKGKNKRVKAILIGDGMHQRDINNSPLALLQACSFKQKHIFHVVMQVLEDEGYIPRTEKQRQIKEEVNRFVRRVNSILKKRADDNEASSK